jgi:DNA-directed RNA polymerase subunit RPC12/RpoP
VGDLLETDMRCPHCRAAVRPGAPWCTLCHADLRPPPPPEPTPAPVLTIPPTATYGHPALDPLTAPAVTLGLPPRTPANAIWPCLTCGTDNALTAATCSACGSGFLASLRESEGPLLELPGVGDLTKMSRAQRLLLALGVVIAISLLVLGLGLLLG